jgi:hypothetical protein
VKLEVRCYVRGFFGNGGVNLERRGKFSFIFQLHFQSHSSSLPSPHSTPRSASYSIALYILRSCSNAVLGIQKWSWDSCLHLQRSQTMLPTNPQMLPRSHELDICREFDHTTTKLCFRNSPFRLVPSYRD